MAYVVVCTTSEGELIVLKLFRNWDAAVRFMEKHVRNTVRKLKQGGSVFYRIHKRLGFSIARQDCFTWYWNIRAIGPKTKEENT